MRRVILSLVPFFRACVAAVPCPPIIHHLRGIAKTKYPIWFLITALVISLIFFETTWANEPPTECVSTEAINFTHNPKIAVDDETIYVVVRKNGFLTQVLGFFGVFYGTAC